MADHYADEWFDNRPLVEDSPEPPTVVCNWFHALIVLTHGSAEVSHGMCGACKARLDAELDERPDRGQQLVAGAQEGVGGTGGGRAARVEGGLIVGGEQVQLHSVPVTHKAGR